MKNTQLIKLKVETAEELPLLLEELYSFGYTGTFLSRDLLTIRKLELSRIVMEYNLIVILLDDSEMYLSNLTLSTTEVVRYMAVFTQEIRDLLINNIKQYESS